jgi:hypothetical protein
MGAVGSSEMLVTIYQTTRPRILQDTNILWKYVLEPLLFNLSMN